MFKKLASVVIVAALLSMLSGSAAFANNTSETDTNTDPAVIPAAVPSKEEAKRNEQLKNNMLKLVADAKAGKIAPAAKPQTQPAKSNNLSTKTKVAIGVGIAVVVLALVVNHALNHMFDDFHPFRQRGN